MWFGQWKCISFKSLRDLQRQLHLLHNWTQTNLMFSMWHCVMHLGHFLQTRMRRLLKITLKDNKSLFNVNLSHFAFRDREPVCILIHLYAMKHLVHDIFHSVCWFICNDWTTLCLNNEWNTYVPCTQCGGRLNIFILFGPVHLQIPLTPAGWQTRPSVQERTELSVLPLKAGVLQHL